MKVLVACEFSGTVREAFAAKGHDAWSCDLLPTERPGQHIEGDVLDVMRQGWDLLIAHPPCTYLAVSGARWWAGRQKEQAAPQADRRTPTPGVRPVGQPDPLGAEQTGPVAESLARAQPHLFRRRCGHGRAVGLGS
jgi:hypothetical protein